MLKNRQSPSHTADERFLDARGDGDFDHRLHSYCGVQRNRDVMLEIVTEFVIEIGMRCSTMAWWNNVCRFKSRIQSRFQAHWNTPICFDSAVWGLWSKSPSPQESRRRSSFLQKCFSCFFFNFHCNYIL